MYGPPAHLPAAQHQLASAIAANTQQDQRGKEEDRAVLAGLEQMMMWLPSPLFSLFFFLSFILSQSPINASHFCFVSLHRGLEILCQYTY